MIYKIKDWVIENAEKLNWGMIFVMCNKYHLIERYWHHFFDYSFHLGIMFNDDLDIYSYETSVDYMSENTCAFSMLSNLPTINWKRMSANSAAIRLLEQNIDNIDWMMLSKNTAAIHLLEQNFKKINWTMLSENPNAEKLLSENIQLVNMFNFCAFNPNAPNIINIMIEKNPQIIDMLYWDYLSEKPNAIHLLEKYPHKINWETIAYNSNALHLIKNNIDKLTKSGWEILAASPFAREFLKKYPTKVNIENVSDMIYEIYNENHSVNISNSNEIINWDDVSFRSTNTEFLRENIEHIDWHGFSMNPNIYEYDYEQMKTNMNILKEELMQKALHPSRVCKWIELGCEDMLE